MKILNPLIDNILQLVKDQVSQLREDQTMEDGVPNASEIKVCDSIKIV